MLLPLSCAIALPASAQTAKHSAGSRQSSSDAASRNQLAAYLVEFQRNPGDSTLRSEIVELAKTMNPAPAIPPPARDSFAKAVAKMTAASSADDFKAAAALFEQAAVQAPWYADADFSAATAYAHGADYDHARLNLTLYMAAVRPGTDTRNADELKSDLDHQQTAQQFQQALQQFTANPTNAGRSQIIKLAQGMKTPPDIPEEARGHYVMAVVLVNSAEDNAGYDRAINEYKAALLAAPWWADAYKKLATIQAAASHYDDAISTLFFYQQTQSAADARSTQDEIYRLKALGQKAADEQAKQQKEEEKLKLIEQNQQNARAVINSSKFTIEGRWYQNSTPNDYFVGGRESPDCDYFVKQNAGRWTITNTCSKSTRPIDQVEFQNRQLSFRLLGSAHDPSFQFAQVTVTLVLSEDGQSLDGRGTAYDKSFYNVGDHPVRWMRRD
jgi:tetratricopeptide (TPR) repeat protein